MWRNFLYCQNNSKFSHIKEFPQQVESLVATLNDPGGKAIFRIFAGNWEKTMLQITTIPPISQFSQACNQNDNKPLQDYDVWIKGHFTVYTS